MKEEERRIRRIRVAVNLTCSVLYQAELTRSQALELVEATRRFILELFPGKEGVYELLVKPRFERILKERFATRSAP